MTVRQCWLSAGTARRKRRRLTADEAGLVEAPAVTLDLLSVVHRLLARCALRSSSPVRHLKRHIMEIKSRTSVWTSIRRQLHPQQVFYNRPTAKNNDSH